VDDISDLPVLRSTSVDLLLLFYLSGFLQLAAAFKVSLSHSKIRTVRIYVVILPGRARRTVGRFVGGQKILKKR